MVIWMPWIGRLAILLSLALASSLSAHAFTVRPAAPEVDRGRGLPVHRISTAAHRLSVILADQGYSEVRFTSEAPPIYVAQACKDGSLFEVTMNRSGDIRAETRFGRCASSSSSSSGGEGEVSHLPEEDYHFPALTVIQRQVAEMGYRHVRFVSTKPPIYVLQACQRGGRFELRVNRRGLVVGDQRIGRCGSNEAEQLPSDTVSASDLQSKLSELGYKHIVFIDARPPSFVVQACQDGRKFALRINREGAITRSSEIGSCSGRPSDGGGWIDAGYGTEQLSTEQIEDILFSRGYLNVRVTREGRRRVVAEACRGGRAFRIRLDWNGHILSREATGSCEEALPSFDRRGIRRVLRSLGYRKIRLDDQASYYLGSACLGVREFALGIKRSGEVDFRKAIGWCDAMRDRDVEILPPNQISREELAENYEIPPSVCQQFLDWIQYNSPVLFETGSARIKRDSRRLLQRLANNMERCRNARLRVEGHTDNEGSRDSNFELSERRAEAVADFLKELGVAPRRLRHAGYGERHPVVSNDSERHRRLNRRIELVLEWDDRSGNRL
mgnify:FL=1